MDIKMGDWGLWSVRTRPCPLKPNPDTGDEHIISGQIMGHFVRIVAVANVRIDRKRR